MRNVLTLARFPSGPVAPVSPPPAQPAHLT